MTLLDALKKIQIVPESVTTTRGSKMIMDAEILKEGEVIKLVTVLLKG